MHELFADWYRTAAPNAARETLLQRWAATSEILDSITTERVAECAGCIARSQLQAPQWFRTVYRTHDEAMPTRGIGEELRVLASIVLRLVFDGGAKGVDGVAAAAALSLLTAAFGMKHEPSWLNE